MGSDDTTTTDDIDLDLDDDTDTDDLDLSLVDDDTDDRPAPRQQAQAKVKRVIEKERQQAQQREAALMGALKETWAADALTQYPLADVESIGLTGIDGAAKEKFLAEVKARHEVREHALAQAGYVRLDGEGKPVEPAPVADGSKPTPVVGSTVEAERQAAQSWGKPLSGTDVQVNTRAQAEKELMDSMKQGPKGVIDLMFKRNKGLSDWITRK